MQSFIASLSCSWLVEDILSPIAGALGFATQELAVLGVFFISYAIWRHLGQVERRAKAARKLKAQEASTASRSAKKVAAPEPSRPADVDQRRNAPETKTQSMEEQMLRHLKQHEFTRALNLYRSLDQGPEQHHFSEQFYAAFIESAVRVGKTDVVERVLRSLRRNGLSCSQEFWQGMLKMLSSRKHFATCLLIHSYFKRQLPTDKVVWSCLCNASLEVGDAQSAAAMLEQYSKADISIKDHILFFRTYLALKDPDSAEALFHKLGTNTSPLMLNLLLLACVNAGQPERGLQLLHEAHEMEDEAPKQLEAVPGAEDSRFILVDTVSYNTVIKGLAQAGVVAGCFQCLRAMISRGLQPDDITFATLMDACIKENNVGAIGEVVNLCQDGEFHIGTVMYTLFIKGLVKANCLTKALDLYQEMKQKAGARPDVITFSVLIKGLVDQRDLERALQLVEDMKSAAQAPDDIILTHLLEGCRHTGDYALGKKLFDEMVADGVKPSAFTLVTMLKLCGHVGAHQEAHDLVAGWEAAYGQKPSVIHYTCLMSGCLRRKHYDLAWAAYGLMKASGVRPDSTTFSTLLPGLVAAQHWDRTLAVAKDALVVPSHKVAPEALNTAVAQMQAADGYARHAAELRELMRAAGLSVAPQRASVAQGRSQAGYTGSSQRRSPS